MKHLRVVFVSMIEKNERERNVNNPEQIMSGDCERGRRVDSRGRERERERERVNDESLPGKDIKM